VGLVCVAAVLTAKLQNWDAPRRLRHSGFYPEGKRGIIQKYLITECINPKSSRKEPQKRGSPFFQAKILLGKIDPGVKIMTRKSIKAIAFSFVLMLSSGVSASASQFPEDGISCSFAQPSYQTKPLGKRVKTSATCVEKESTKDLEGKLKVCSLYFDSLNDKTNIIQVSQRHCFNSKPEQQLTPLRKTIYCIQAPCPQPIEESQRDFFKTLPNPSQTN
jgi:hypothetical protein